MPIELQYTIVSSWARAEQTVLRNQERRLETMSQPELVGLTRAFVTLLAAAKQGRMPSPEVMRAMPKYGDILISS